jgi:hypothetical protein
MELAAKSVKISSDNTREYEPGSRVLALERFLLEQQKKALLELT